MKRSAESDAVDYETRLGHDTRWALSEGSRHFDEKSAVFDALHRIAARLDELGIPYAVVGGLALFRHGYRRFTEDVDLLVTKEGLTAIHRELEGLGYRLPHARSRNLRDAENGVRIEFLTAGDYPGDGKPKPVAFPDPAAVASETGGIKFIDLERLMELKLASGMTSPGRLRDLSDVMELIKALRLGAEFASRLHPYVREKYRELWASSAVRYVKPWPGAAAAGQTLEARIAAHRAAGEDSLAETLSAMLRDGIYLESDPRDEKAIRLATTDSAIASKYDMLPETED